MKRTFIYTDDKSNKFWTIEVTGNSYTVNYGKAGTAGQTQTKDFADEAACLKAAEKLIAEKTKKGYVETDELPVAAPKADKPSALKIPKYKGHDEAYIDENQFVVNLKKPLSILSAFKYQIDNYDEFLYNLQNMPREEALTYGIIDDDEFIPLTEAYEDDDMGEHDEEILAGVLSGHPELFPFLEQYAKTVIIESSKKEHVTGPWASKYAIFGEYIIPMLARADSKYFYLLEQYIDANIEIKIDHDFRSQFAEKYEKIATKWGLTTDGFPDFSAIYDLPETYPVSITIPAYVQPEGLKDYEFIVDIDNPQSIASVLQYHIDNFDDYAKAVEQRIYYGTIADGKFVKHDIVTSGYCSSSELQLYEAAASYPELHGLMANYILRVISECEKQKSSGPWVNTEFLLGGTAIEMLVHADTAYAPLLIHYMRTHTEIRCEPSYREQYDVILNQALNN